MKPINVALIAVLFLIIGIAAASWYFKSKNVYYDLPLEGSTGEWGPKYWKSLHSTVERIPCSICQREAVQMMKFMHDAVNLKLEKNLYDEDNFNKWLAKFSEIKAKRDMTNGR